ncbi:hypothetical protein HK405_001530, partial [Cladochytrium tenue]
PRHSTAEATTHAVLSSTAIHRLKSCATAAKARPDSFIQAALAQPQRDAAPAPAATSTPAICATAGASSLGAPSLLASLLAPTLINVLVTASKAKLHAEGAAAATTAAACDLLSALAQSFTCRVTLLRPALGLLSAVAGCVAAFTTTTISASAADNPLPN